MGRQQQQLDDRTTSLSSFELMMKLSLEGAIGFFWCVIRWIVDTKCDWNGKTINIPVLLCPNNGEGQDETGEEKEAVRQLRAASHDWCCWDGPFDRERRSHAPDLYHHFELPDNLDISLEMRHIRIDDDVETLLLYSRGRKKTTIRRNWGLSVIICWTVIKFIAHPNIQATAEGGRVEGHARLKSIQTCCYYPSLLYRSTLLLVDVVLVGLYQIYRYTLSKGSSCST